MGMPPVQVRRILLASCTHVRLHYRDHINLNHRITAQNRGRRPVLSEPWLFGIASRSDGRSQRLTRAIVEVLAPCIRKTGGLRNVAANPLTHAAGGTVVEAIADQFRIGQDAFDRGQFRMRFGQVSGNPPRCDTAIR